MHRPSVLMKSFHLKFQMTVFAVLGHMFPSMTACREEICGELLLTDVANPPAKVKIRGMVLLLRQLQLRAKSLFQQQALNQSRVLETAKQADIFKDFFLFRKTFRLGIVRVKSELQMAGRQGASSQKHRNAKQT